MIFSLDMGQKGCEVIVRLIKELENFDTKCSNKSGQNNIDKLT